MTPATRRRVGTALRSKKLGWGAACQPSGRVHRSVLRLQPVVRAVSPRRTGTSSSVRSTVFLGLRNGERHIHDHRRPQHLVTGFNGVSWEANRQPHMHSYSRYIDMVRIALLLEEGQTLHLMAGTPRGMVGRRRKDRSEARAKLLWRSELTAQSHVARARSPFRSSRPVAGAQKSFCTCVRRPGTARSRP